MKSPLFSLCIFLILATTAIVKAQEELTLQGIIQKKGGESKLWVEGPPSLKGTYLLNLTKLPVAEKKYDHDKLFVSVTASLVPCLNHHTDNAHHCLTVNSLHPTLYDPLKIK